MEKIRERKSGFTRLNGMQMGKKIDSKRHASIETCNPDIATKWDMPVFLSTFQWEKEIKDCSANKRAMVNEAKASLKKFTWCFKKPYKKIFLMNKNGLFENSAGAIFRKDLGFGK